MNPVCVPKGTYTLTIVGSDWYTAHINGDEVLFGRNQRYNTASHEIITGYEPPMSDIEKEWLAEHNTRREAFHKEHNTEYRPLGHLR